MPSARRDVSKKTLSKRKETDKGALRAMRRFLINAGIRPEDDE